MWPIVGILLIGLLVWIFEIKTLLKNKSYREIIIYSFLLISGLSFAILLALNIRIPTPLDFLNRIYSPIISSIERFLS
ncbi:hypothetical protein [Metabacillus halosaccharovorans]|uniref:hypothetical protein n=1 Tax=Metabacillus halosaccharovorans TaxID=930124 RepID=UPI001C1F3A3E|nr:hypothetical protein [Metabacillus halosaccharovorans]MBU7595356.1 hypothetical protein [Metabacillus halosaccharovorans]